MFAVRRADIDSGGGLGGAGVWNLLSREERADFGVARAGWWGGVGEWEAMERKSEAVRVKYSVVARDSPRISETSSTVNDVV